MHQTVQGVQCNMLRYDAIPTRDCERLTGHPLKSYIFLCTECQHIKLFSVVYISDAHARMTKEKRHWTEFKHITYCPLSNFTCFIIKNESQKTSQNARL